MAENLKHPSHGDNRRGGGGRIHIASHDHQGESICGDYKSTVNQVSKLDSYPIPKVEDLLAILGGGEKFTKLDMSQAYQ